MQLFSIQTWAFPEVKVTSGDYQNYYQDMYKNK